MSDKLKIGSPGAMKSIPITDDATYNVIYNFMNQSGMFLGDVKFTSKAGDLRSIINGESIWDSDGNLKKRIDGNHGIYCELNSFIWVEL